MSTVATFDVTNGPLTRDLEEVFQEHYALVYRTAYGVTGSPQDAEDIVQSLFLQLLRLGFPGGLKDNPKAYLYRATINLSLNAVKARRRLVPIEDPARLEAPATGTTESDERAQRRLIDALAQLSPKAVEILVLRYKHNYSDAEIGKLLGTSRGVIAVTLYRARARLKKLLLLEEKP